MFLQITVARIRFVDSPARMGCDSVRYLSARYHQPVQPITGQAETVRLRFPILNTRTGREIIPSSVSGYCPV